MVVTEPDVISQGEADSAIESDPENKTHINHTFSSLGRQSSIYSLTLDEFQHTLCESGNNFGSMNMDKFLTSIWNAEENQATANNDNESDGQINGNGNNPDSKDGNKGMSKQPSLPRQGSLTLLPPLCRKTGDEVWSEIHGGQSSGGVLNSESASRQPTFGGMTLEDFLVKAGVVREQQQQSSERKIPPQQQYGFVSRPTLGMTDAAGGGRVSYHSLPEGAVGMFETPGSNGGGYAAAGGMGAVVTSSAGGGVENIHQYGMEMGRLRCRKRVFNGPVDKVVERRHRRMIKNRESAARSRARKQAYTVELEAELNQLKEENKQLKHALAEVEIERKRKQQYFEELRMRGQTKAEKANEKLRMWRRNSSCPL